MKYLPLFLFLIATSVYAADLAPCGRDTDRNGSVDNACGTEDADFDGYSSENDCNDSDWTTYPGSSTLAGCSAGSFRTCGDGGTYLAACAATSTYTCHTGSGSTYWVDDAETDCTGAGTYADPEDYRCWVNTGMSGYHAPVAGDCIVFQEGTYTASWGSAPVKQIYLTVDGNSTHPINWRCEPGKVCAITGAGTSPNYVHPWHFEQAQYHTIRGKFEIDGNYACGGIDVQDESDNIKIYDVYIYDTDGNTVGGDNCAGIKIHESSDSTTVSHVHLKDNYDRAAPDNQNNAQLYVSGGNNHVFEYNTLHSPTSASAKIFYFKHAVPGASSAWTFKGNILDNAAGPCTKINSGGGLIANNIFSRCTSAAISYEGGDDHAHFDESSVIENNTVLDSFPIQLFTQESYEQNTTFGTVTVRRNVFIDDRSSAYGSTGENGFVRICHFCSNTIHDEIIGEGKISFSDNTYFNSAGSPPNLFYTVFGDTGAGNQGATYSTCASWTSSGLSTSDNCENPTLDADKICTSANCIADGAGWASQGGGGGQPPPTAGSGTTRKFKTKRGRL